MTGAGLEVLTELRARGIRVERVEGNQLAVTPASLLDDPLRAAIRASKQAILAALKEQAFEPTDIGAVKLWSHLVGRDLWLARDQQVAAELVAEMEQTGERLPVVLLDEVEPLCRKSPAMIRAVLDALAELPRTRLLQ